MKKILISTLFTIALSASVTIAHAARIHNAAFFGNFEGVKQAIEVAKEDVNSIDANGQTALMTAAYYGNEEILNYLLDHGANVNLVNMDGDTALINAASYGRTSRAQALLTHGALVNHANNIGETALLRAAKGLNTDCVNTLLSHGADVNQTSSTGKTALMCAAFYSRTETVKSLLSTIRATQSFDCLYYKDNEGKTAIDMTTNDKIKSLISASIQEYEQRRFGNTKCARK